MTGSKPHAASGALVFLVGGDAQVLARIRDVFAPMSRDVLHLGPTGSGALVKLINNFMCGVQAAALAEALALIEKSGLDRDRALGVLVEDQGVALRGLFIIDPEGIVRYQVVHDENIGRSVDETLRVLQALQTGGLCPSDWKPGQKTL